MTPHEVMIAFDRSFNGGILKYEDLPLSGLVRFERLVDGLLAMSDEELAAFHRVNKLAHATLFWFSKYISPVLKTLSTTHPLHAYLTTVMYKYEVMSKRVHDLPKELLL